MVIMSQPAPSFVGIVLAAGLSVRMGRDKSSLPWVGGELLLPWMVRAFCDGGWAPIVVLGPHNHAQWTDRLPGVTLCLNEDPTRGKITSLVTGLAALPVSATHVMISAIDQPRPPELYATLRTTAAQREEAVIVPDENGHRGHPVVLRAGLREEFSRLSECDEGLRGLLDRHRHSTLRIPAQPGSQAWDCNTPDSYQAALAAFESQYTT